MTARASESSSSDTSKKSSGDRDRMWSENILAALHELPEAPRPRGPRRDFRGEAIKARFLSDRLKGYDVHSKDVRIAKTVKRGIPRSRPARWPQRPDGPGLDGSEQALKFILATRFVDVASGFLPTARVRR